MLTSVLGGEFAHGGWQALVELVLPRDKRLADGLLPEAKHTGMAAHLVHEGLKENPFFFPQSHRLLWLHPFDGWTHPPRA